ncbi:MAG TPA: polysaccharide deacetylase family protein [Terriglobales bacterium]|nr:polysaccharide deacetylase family protein [Terriglobales bacterium]
MKRLALHAMRAFGIFSLSRHLSASMPRILMYHNFSGPGTKEAGTLNVEAARAQLEYLHRYFRVVPLLDIAERLSSGKKFDSNTVALTIDDGRFNCYEFLFPLLKEFQIPATFFVVSSFICKEDWIWTDKVLWLSTQPNAPAELSSTKIDAFFRTLNRMRPEVRNARIGEMAAKLNISVPREAPTQYAPCSWAQLREMADSGLVEIGSHTVTHPILSSIADEESWHELTESRRQLKEGLGRQIRSFCFPNGMPGDYRESQVKQIRDAGYACSVIAQFGLINGQTNPYLMPRIGMGSKSERIEFAKFLDGVAHYQRTLKGLVRH